MMEGVWKEHVINHVKSMFSEMGGSVEALTLTWSRDTWSSEMKQ
jgi:hypothetical protein